jgi:hypothetical protein
MLPLIMTWILFNYNFTLYFLPHPTHDFFCGGGRQTNGIFIIVVMLKVLGCCPRLHVQLDVQPKNVIYIFRKFWALMFYIEVC